MPAASRHMNAAGNRYPQLPVGTRRANRYPKSLPNTLSATLVPGDESATPLGIKGATHTAPQKSAAEYPPFKPTCTRLPKPISTLE